MTTRHALIALALTLPVHGQQQAITSMRLALGQVIEASDGAAQEGEAVEVQVDGQPVGARPAAMPGGGGEVDFDRLRQMIEESKKRPAPSVEQQKMQMLQELRFDRSTAGILATRLEEARANAAPAPQPAAAANGQPAPPANGKPEEANNEKKQQEELAKFRKDAQTFRRDVVLGRWDKVREFLAALPKEIAPEIYQTIVGKLSAPSQVPMTPEMIQQGSKPHSQTAFLPPADLLGLMGAAPVAPQPKQVESLAKLLAHDLRPPVEFFDTLSKGIPHFGGEKPEDRSRAARFLIQAGLVKDAGPYLPDAAQAKEKKDYLAMNLIARHRTELFRLDKKAAGKEALPLAWELSTSFLTDRKAPPPARSEALFRALTLIPELGDDTGKRWLEATFKEPQGEGLELLASLGTLTAQSRENPDEEFRLEQLKLQNAAVTTLLGTQGVDPAVWSNIFTLFARQWSHEAEVTRQKDQSNSRSMVPQYDEWGNMFFTRANTGYQGSGTRPIGAGILLEQRPGDAWLATVEPATRNECLLAIARLFLKVKEENRALPVIKTLAATDKEQAKSLVRELIRVWTENHNPNEAQDYRSRYMYFYGFNNQSGSIPLTRSKQERNLVELAALVKGIRTLDLGESFQTELADAFISCHSRAEVWRVEAIESVFGNTEKLDTPTIATLVSRMRLNLAALWPNPKLQQTFQTKRKDKELQEQILYGYDAAQKVLRRALSRRPDDSWRIMEQLAALRYEETNYASTIAPDNKHSATKRETLGVLADAAKQYIATLPLEDPDKETTSVFETWFFASLGSPSLEALKSHHVGSPDEYAKIKAALDTIPSGSHERHLKSFATVLNTRLANVAPDLKLRYLEGAAAIAGDHEAFKDAAEVLAYYRDLTREIELHAAIDGNDRVGTDSPFGLKVNLRHTSEIERESGGFQKYLQNQTNSPYGFNYGRPPEDYRDKFEKAARAALEEHFEVVSVTYHSDKVESLTDPQHGWRLTPYAYLLLKPKGPQIDKVPPLKIDLDFTDTSGYVVLPITSSEVPLDASKAEPRPYRDLKVTQTLDERSHKEKGSLFLEVKASAHGLIPSLKELMADQVEGFETGAIEDRGLRIQELDAAAEDLSPISEHEWRVELKPKSGVLPASFQFPAVKTELAKEDGLTRQRYVDVDLVPVGETVALGGTTRRTAPWLAGGIAALVATGAGGIAFSRRKKDGGPSGPENLPLPAHINVVSIIGYLRRLQSQDEMPSGKRAEIEREIAELEATHFGRDEASADPAALEAIARKWQAA